MGLIRWIKRAFRKLSFTHSRPPAVPKKYRTEVVSSRPKFEDVREEIYESEYRNGVRQKGSTTREIKTPRLPFCDMCHEKFKDYLESYECRYCGGGFCPRHRIPESHACSGKPHSIPKSGRFVHSGGQSWGYGK